MADYTLLLQLGALLIAIGALAGFLSGLLGVGGGIIFVSSLFFTFTSLGITPDHVMHLTIGTSFAVICLTVGFSSLRHHKRGAVDIDLIKSWAPFLIAGVGAGSLIAGYLDGDVLKKAFSFMVMFGAVYMTFARDKAVGDRPRFLTVAVQRGICFVIGILAALTGVGGALLTVPLMTYSAVPMQRAVGTGAGLGLLTSIPAVIGYLVMGWPHMTELPPFSVGYVFLPVAVVLASASVPLVPVGVRVSHNMDRKVLRRIFAGVLMIVSIRMLMS